MVGLVGLLVLGGQGVRPASGLAIGGVAVGGRRPIPSDAIVDKIAAGNWATPLAGDTVSFRGAERKWHEIKPNADGWFEDPSLENGYLDLVDDEPVERRALLRIEGNSAVYVNGALRAGDPYGMGYLVLPVNLRQGPNELLCVAGRGRIRATIMPAEKPVSLQTEDATLPDLLTTDRSPLWASVTLRNATGRVAEGFSLRAKLPDGRSETVRAGTTPAMTIRKEGFRVPIPKDAKTGKVDLEVDLMEKGAVVDSIHLDLQVKGPLETHKRTFVSDLDASVQYYAVVPAGKPSPSNALVLTLHGASVEASGQAAAYAQKDWATLVAPTNRRPYGFDWEDIGRLDALEVLDIAKKEYPHDPNRVDLTGHSMGGHGTWAIGTLYPDLFASIGPSAGWISFWSYAGGWSPRADSPTEVLLRRSMNVGDTLGRVRNTLSENVFILHGAVDDNVPVEQARTMKAALEGIGHAHLQYHEEPGAKHWWGNQCMDWPPLFQMIETSRLAPNRDSIDFTTQNPAVSSKDAWVTVEQQEHPLDVSHVVAVRDGKSVTITSTNVQRLEVGELPADAELKVDDSVLNVSGHERVELEKGVAGWKLAGSLGPGSKNPQRSGPFKQAFNHRFLFVVGTAGDSAATKWAEARARFDGETMAYRGNGSPEIVLDRDYTPGRYRGRDVILYGNRDTNSAWKALLAKCPIQVGNGTLEIGSRKVEGAGLSALVVYPSPFDHQCLVAGIGGSDLSGCAFTDRLGIFSSGVGYPDWIVLDPSAPGRIAADGFFDNRWQLSAGDTAWASR